MKKSLIFLFGIIAYVVFLVSFLYAIGFVGNIIVPKTIDSGTNAGFAAAFLVNALLLSVFAIQHSVMARPAFKKWWTTIVSPAVERSIYVLLASLALLLIFWQWQPITSTIWETKNPTAILVINGIFWLGWGIVLLSTFFINHFRLFGLDQVYNNLKNRKPSKLAFQVNFLYKLVRHPIMLGFIIAFWATPTMTTGHLMFSVITTLYIFISVKHLEEPDLKNDLGEEYVAYQKEVPMIIPFLKRKKINS